MWNTSLWISSRCVNIWKPVQLDRVIDCRALLSSITYSVTSIFEAFEQPKVSKANGIILKLKLRQSIMRRASRSSCYSWRKWRKKKMFTSCSCRSIICHPKHRIVAMMLDQMVPCPTSWELASRLLFFSPPGKLMQEGAANIIHPPTRSLPIVLPMFIALCDQYLMTGLTLLCHRSESMRWTETDVTSRGSSKNTFVSWWKEPRTQQFVHLCHLTPRWKSILAVLNKVER